MELRTPQTQKAAGFGCFISLTKIVFNVGAVTEMQDANVVTQIPRGFKAH